MQISCFERVCVNPYLHPSLYNSRMNFLRIESQIHVLQSVLFYWLLSVRIERDYLRKFDIVFPSLSKPWFLKWTQKSMNAKLFHPATFLKLFLSFFGLENLKGKSWSRRKAKISKQRKSALFDHFCSNICECFRCWLTQNKWWTCIFSSFS